MQLYIAAEALGRLNAWDKIFTRDAVKDDVMGEAYCQDGLPNYVKDGSDWPRTNHKGDSRTKRYTNPKPNSTDFKQREAKIRRACARRDVPPPPFLSQQERRMGRTLCRSARVIRVRAGSKRSGAGTGPDVRPAKRRAGSRKGVKATRCNVSAANGAGGVDGGHSGMEAEEEDGPVGEVSGEAPGQASLRQQQTLQ